MQQLRCDARRVIAARRERADASPAHIVAPLLAAVIVISGTTAISLALGLSPALVALISIGVALLGAVVEHRSVASVLSGAILLLARPFEPGEKLRVYLPARGGLVDAELVRIGLANTTLATSSGLLRVPNSRLLRGAPEIPAADLSL